MQAANYFLDPVRMKAPMYFWHLLDIVRSKIGGPLLQEIAQRDQTIAQHLDPDSQNSILVHSHIHRSSTSKPTDEKMLGLSFL